MIDAISSLLPTYAPETDVTVPNQDAGEALITAAIWLFCRHGIKNTGVEKIISRAGVSKMTLYNRFSTKEGLVAAAVEVEAEQWREWLFSYVRSGEPDVRYGRILLVFSALFDWFSRKDYFGCLIMKAAIEFGDDSPEITRIFNAHKTAMILFLTELCEDNQCEKCDILSSMLMTIVDGSIVKSLLTKNADYGLEAGEMAKIIIESFLPVSLSCQ